MLTLGALGRWFDRLCSCGSSGHPGFGPVPLVLLKDIVFSAGEGRRGSGQPGSGRRPPDPRPCAFVGHAFLRAVSSSWRHRSRGGASSRLAASRLFSTHGARRSLRGFALSLTFQAQLLAVAQPCVEPVAKSWAVVWPRRATFSGPSRGRKANHDNTGLSAFVARAFLRAVSPFVATSSGTGNRVLSAQP